jgi:hypothetical protein
MNEAELVSHLLSRNEALWDLTQWWVSISFAVMVAAYIGAKYLSRILVGFIIFMYAFYSFAVMQRVVQHFSYYDPIENALSVLASSSQLGTVGQAALEHVELGAGVYMPVFLFLAFLTTIGFVIFCKIKVKNG